MFPIQNSSINSRIYIESAAFIGMAVLAGSTRLIQYFPGASTKELLLSAGLGSATIAGSEWMFSGKGSDQNRRICIVAGLVLSTILSSYIIKTLTGRTDLNLGTFFRFAGIEAAIILGVEIFSCLKSSESSISEQELQISEKELQAGVIISEDTISKIQACMADVLKRGEVEGIKLYPSQHSHRVFSIETIPGYVFKMNGLSMNLRYKKMIYAHAVCRIHQLGLLVIPKAKLFTVQFGGQEYEMVAEQKLDITPEESAQEQFYKEYATSLNEAIRQLAIFICKTDYSDVEWRNNPVLVDSLDEKGQRKIALIDLEETDSREIGLFGGGCGRRGLVRCVSSEQGKIVERVALEHGVDTTSYATAFARRKQELDDGGSLVGFYLKKGVIQGDEPVKLPEGIDFSPYTHEQQNTLQELTEKLIKKINDDILKSSPQESIKGRRYIYINPNNGPFYKMDQLIDKSKDSNRDFATNKEYYNATLLGCVVKQLVDLEAIYKLDKCNGHGYFLQA